jgi:hypothetical protein
MMNEKLINLLLVIILAVAVNAAIPQSELDRKAAKGIVILMSLIQSLLDCLLNSLLPCSSCYQISQIFSYAQTHQIYAKRIGHAASGRVNIKNIVARQ